MEKTCVEFSELLGFQCSSPLGSRRAFSRVYWALKKLKVQKFLHTFFSQAAKVIQINDKNGGKGFTENKSELETETS